MADLSRWFYLALAVPGYGSYLDSRRGRIVLFAAGRVLEKRSLKNVKVTSLRGFSRRSGGLMG